MPRSREEIEISGRNSGTVIQIQYTTRISGTDRITSIYPAQQALRLGLRLERPNARRIPSGKDAAETTIASIRLSSSPPQRSSPGGAKTSTAAAQAVSNTTTAKRRSLGTITAQIAVQRMPSINQARHV